MEESKKNLSQKFESMSIELETYKNSTEEMTLEVNELRFECERLKERDGARESLLSTLESKLRE
jgi:regulator of replication initiation timing